MTVSPESRVRDAASPQVESASGSTPNLSKIPGPHWGEFLDDLWGEEFDRRLAAWESEAPTASADPSPGEGFGKPR